MKVAILYDAHDFRIEDRAVPEFSENQCLIKVEAIAVFVVRNHFSQIRKLIGSNIQDWLVDKVSRKNFTNRSKVSKFVKGDKVSTLDRR